VKYSTVQNWFPGDGNTGGILNFVTKRALCEGENSKMSWTQSETDRPLPGNTQAVFCVETTPSVSFTRSP
jgi:Fe-S cluster assembly scaffold protein SufB